VRSAIGCTITLPSRPLKYTNSTTSVVCSSYKLQASFSFRLCMYVTRTPTLATRGSPSGGLISTPAPVARSNVARRTEQLKLLCLGLLGACGTAEGPPSQRAVYRVWTMRLSFLLFAEDWVGVERMRRIVVPGVSALRNAAMQIGTDRSVCVTSGIVVSDFARLAKKCRRLRHWNCAVTRC